jgi:hypothetical protein
VSNAAGHPLSGVDVHVDVRGKETVVRTGVDGRFTVTIPRNIPQIGIRVAFQKERFSGQVRVASPIEIKLSPLPPGQ